MKNIICVVALSLLAYSPARAETLSLEDQTRIITGYGIATGQIAAPAPTDQDKQHPPDKCGTAVVNEFTQCRDLLDPALLSALGVQMAGRPDSLILPRSYGSPAARFLVHYVDTGINAVYQPNVRTLVDTVPDYVVMIARIADSVYTHIIDTLGYPQPPVDGFYPIGLDDRFDIYLLNLSPQFYGLTYLEAQVTSITATSYLVLDNDYQSIAPYANRPLDAARVTTAHEYFHAVQFGMDFTEYDGYPAATRRQYWMEMSAVWMEEECYDDINDYYAYLPSVFEYPTVSLQSFGAIGTELHPYGSALFALYLTQQYADSIIRNIWQRCADHGPGSQFLQACEQIVNSHNNQATLATTMNDYAVWNYFTGQYASLAPPGIGYEEAAQYPVIPLTEMLSVRQYPFLELKTVGEFRPQYNGTAYLLFSDFDTRNRCRGTARLDTSATPDTIVAIACDSTLPPAEDSLYPCSFVPISCDSVLPVLIGVEHPGFVEWSISLIYHLFQPADSVIIDKLVVPVGPIPTDLTVYLEVDAFHPNNFKSIAMMISPTSISPGMYLGTTAPKVGYAAVSDSGGFALRPTAALTPYPNPAVVNSMAGRPLTFRFQVANDATNTNITSDPLLLIDLYTIAGEFVRSINATFGGEDRLGVHSEGIYETGWNMKNSAGKEVASGVYLAYARLWETPLKNKLLAESKSKIALIR